MVKVNEIRIGNKFNFSFSASMVRGEERIDEYLLGQVNGMGNDGKEQITDLRYDNPDWLLKGGLATCKIADLMPIPLTPEILQRCGCLIIDENNGIIGNTETGQKKIMQLNIKGGHRLDIDFIAKEVSINYAIRVRNFEYLHQLQNLVFCLSGEELVIQELV